MEISPYFSLRPTANLDPGTISQFEKLYLEAVQPGTGKEIDYRLQAPKWQFLCYLADTKNIVLHGSGNANIEEFEPRQSNDTEEFGNRCAVYAASDGLWSMFFAIVDRENHVKSVSNACFSVIEDDGSRNGPYYFFSVDDEAFPKQPWREGMLYILPRDTFEHQPISEERGAKVDIAQWASLVAVKPLAKLRVSPDDFPFLSRIYPHNLKQLRERIARDPQGFPWMED